MEGEREGGEKQGVGAASAAAAVTRESHKISISIGVRRFPRCAYPDPERIRTRGLACLGFKLRGITRSIHESRPFHGIVNRELGRIG